MDRKVLVAILLILVVLLGVVAGVFILRRQQDIREEAAVPEGDAEVVISPSTANLTPGETTSVSVLFDPAGIAINGVAVRLSYTYSESVAPVNVTNIMPALEEQGDWTCPVQDFVAEAGSGVIEVACFNSSESGFSASGETLFATFDLVASAQPEINPFTLSFDPNESKITSYASGEDILLIPTSTGSYRVSSAGSSQFPSTDPSASPAATATASASPTASPTTTSSPTASPVSELPDAGIGGPAILGIAVGGFMLLGAFFLAI